MKPPTIHNVQQGTPEWLQLRCGMLTASEVKLILTPTLKAANNDKSRQHLYELLGQRITGHVEPHYISDDMLRGQTDEVRALAMYEEHYAPVQRVGFVTREFTVDGLTFTLGCSPDGLVSDDGGVEGKSRRQKYQVQTVLDIGAGLGVPEEYRLQIQTNLLVTNRTWWDFISFSGGMVMAVERVHVDTGMRSAILSAAHRLELSLASERRRYDATVKVKGWKMTERAAIADTDMDMGESV